MFTNYSEWLDYALLTPLIQGYTRKDIGQLTILSQYLKFMLSRIKQEIAPDHIITQCCLRANSFRLGSKVGTDVIFFYSNNNNSKNNISNTEYHGLF